MHCAIVVIQVLILSNVFMHSIYIYIYIYVMRMGEDRLLKQVMMQVMELGDGVQWRQDLEKKFKDVWVGRIAI